MTAQMATRLTLRSFKHKERKVSNNAGDPQTDLLQYTIATNVRFNGSQLDVFPMGHVMYCSYLEFKHLCLKNRELFTIRVLKLF